MTSRIRALTGSIAILALSAAAAVAAGTPTGAAGSGAAAQIITVPDFTGLWRLDRAASDAPPPGMRGPRGGGRGGGSDAMHGPGGPDTRRGDGGPPPGGGGGPRRLPELIHITQGDVQLSVEDSTGAVLQEITTDGSKPKTKGEAGSDMRFGTGNWNQGTLEVTRTGPRGTVREQYSLTDQGGTLVVWTRVTGRDGEPREFKRVYRRQAE